METMDSLSKKHNSIKSEKLMEEETYVKDYTEAEVEQYLRFINSKDANAKESEFNTTFEGVEDNLQKLYMEDLAKDYQKCNFSYQPKSNNLSIISMKNRLLSIIETNSVVVIQGPTGCGKTTQIPQFILDASIKKRLNCNIIVTQPRRIAAINIAKRVSQEGGWPLGNLIGYKVGMRKKTSEHTRLTYCTTEVLLNLLISEKHMLRYTHIILDEIHERDQNLDFLLLVVKKLLQTNSGQVKIILMSATIDVMRFAEYFSTRVGNKFMPAPIVKIPEKRNFKICTYYLDEIENLGMIPEVSLMEPKVTEDMINFCSLIINALDQVDINDNEDSNSPQRHSVLIFLPGIYEIEELYNYLSSVYHINKLWDLVILHSLISSDEQQQVFYKPPEGYRRIILSTNVAESSITVPDVKYVIDFCLIKVLEVDSITHYQTLKLCWASKANCTQRAGRAGRVMDGRVYRLVPKAFYDNIFNNEGTPEMLRAPLANIVLRAKILDLDEPRALLSLSLNPPSLSNLAATILTLKEVGALVNKDDSFQPFDGKLTDLGRIMAFIPLDIRITKLIMLGHVFGVLRDTIILGTSMALKDVFNITQCRSNVSSYATRRKWAYDSDSDCIATLNVYKTWQNEKSNRRLTTYQAQRQWAQRNGVQLKTLRELDALVNEITDRLLKLGITESTGVNKVTWEDTDRDFVLQVALAGAFYPNYFVKRMQNLEIYKENIIMSLGALDPMKTVYLRGWPIGQPGYLYAKQFQESFAKHQGIPEKQIAVFFDESKRVYVQFHEKTPINDNFYNISNFVYQAVKMRHCDVPIKINLLNIKEAHQMAKYHNVCKFERTLFFHKNLRRIESNSYKIRPELPGLDVTYIPLFIQTQTIISPGYFWAILDDNATNSKLRIIENILNKHPLKELSSPPKISTIIAAPMERDDSLIYHRAIIEDFTSGIGELADIFFIDNGRSSRVRCSDLREINDTTVLNMPPLAFRCNLAFLRPSNQANFHGRWSKRSKEYFVMQIKEKSKIFGKIYSVVDNTVNLELIAVNEKGEEFNVNNDMIKEGLARRKEESYLSTYNHELRVNISNSHRMSMEEKKFYEEEQYDKDYLLKYPDPPKEDCDFSIKLQGPYSPLEMELIQLTSVGKLKKTIVDSNSVNCVLLDDDHDQSSGRLLVAQIVNQGSNSGGLILRNTTFLPNIPGLAALLALSFAPCIELRCNSRRTCYTGALCGLGPMDNCTRQAMFPDHDMEIKFDVEITIDDVKEINKLRHWMNAGMQLDQNSNCEHIINCQNRIKRILLELRNKQRKSRNPLNDEIDYYSDKWNCYEKSCFLQSIQETTRQCDIYPLHKALELREMDEEKEEMLEHLSELQHLAYEDVLKMKNVAIFCKLCGMKTFGLLELRSHEFSFAGIFLSKIVLSVYYHCIIMQRTLSDCPFLRMDFLCRKLRYCTSTATAELCNNKRLTDFPATFKSKDVEQGWYDIWQHNNYFTASRLAKIRRDKYEEEEKKEPFSMVLPPPNITGVLHLGHALTVTIQDVLARWHRMKGHPVLWIPGLDHAGIATQAVVERMLQRTRNITRHDMGRVEFRRLLWQWKTEKATIINQQLKALGATLDWNREYFTIDETHSAAVTETFVRLNERNLLYRARDLVNWSPALRSTISEIEVEDFVIDGKTQLQLPGHYGKVIVGQLIKLAYPIKDSKEELIVATTRLETIFGDVAIAVHPDDERYSRYIGRQVLHPIKETFIPVIADSSVKRDFGTGAVKITPAHDRSDYSIAKRHGLPVISVIDEAGNMTDICKEFKGLSRFVTREKLVNELSARGIIRGVEDHHRMILPRCSRTHDVIEYLPKEQWFVRCTAMARRAHEAVKNGELRIDSSDDGIYEQLWYDWLGNVRDWCVSRQLWWGHRIPAYSVNHGDNNNDNGGDNDIFSTSSSSKTSWIIARSEEEAYSRAREKYGDTVSIHQDSDVLDTWFSSAIIPFVTLGWPEHTKDVAKYYPLTLMETGHDIFLFWVARMVMLSLEMTQNLPFKEVLLHGVLCDANGKKMSKSSGNVILPENIMNGCSFEELNAQARRNHAAGILSAAELQRTLRVNAKSYSAGITDCGADALRLSLCARNIKNRTISFDIDDCRTSKYFCNKIWQASKYVLLMAKNGEDNEDNQQQHGDKGKKYLSNLDRWILSRLSWMVETVNSAFAERNFHKAIAAIRQFLHYEFCDLYVEGTKFGFRSGNAAGHFDTLAKCLEVSLRLLAPVTPYLSDDLYMRLVKKGLPGFQSVSSLLETSYPVPYEFEHLRDIVLEEKMCELVNVIDVIRSCMANVSKKSNPKVNILTSNMHDYDFYRENVNLIKGVSRIWNVPIHLTESANDGDFRNETTKGNDNPDDGGIYTTRYIHTNDCLLLIAVTDASMLEQIKKNIARKEKLEKRNQEKNLC